MKQIVIILIGLVISSCNNVNINADNNVVNRSVPKSSNFVDCPIHESRDWHAWVDRFANKNIGYRLNIVGLVDLPSPNYEVSWSLGITDRANPPSQRLTISAINNRRESSIQVITPTRIEFKQRTALSTYHKVMIFCENRLLTTIYDVGLTD